MKDQYDPPNPNLNNNLEHQSKKKIRILLTLVIILSLLSFTLGGALIALFITKKITIDIKFGDNLSESPTSTSKPSLTPSPELSPTPSQETVLTPPSDPTPTLTPSPDSSDPTPSPPPAQKLVSSNSLEVQGLTFELQECTRSNITTTNQSISCSVLITSQRENTDLRLYSYSSGSRRSRIIESGEEYLANRIEFGQYSGTSPSNSLLKDVAIEASFVFDEVPLELNTLEALEISAYLDSSYYRDDIKIEFRQVLLPN